MTASRYRASDVELVENRMQIEWGMTPEGRWAYCVRQQSDPGPNGEPGTWKLLYYSELIDEAHQFATAHIGSGASADSANAEYGMDPSNPLGPRTVTGGDRLSGEPAIRERTNADLPGDAPAGPQTSPGPALSANERATGEDRSFPLPVEGTTNFGASTSPGGAAPSGDASGVNLARDRARATGDEVDLGGVGMAGQADSSPAEPATQAEVAEGEADAMLAKQANPEDVNPDDPALADRVAEDPAASGPSVAENLEREKEKGRVKAKQDVAKDQAAPKKAGEE